MQNGENTNIKVYNIRVKCTDSQTIGITKLATWEV